MKALRRAALLGVLVFSCTLAPSWVLTAQEAVALVQPALTPEQLETFLLKAKIIGDKGINTGINNTRRATLSDGQITHDVHIQTVEISKPVFTPDRGPTELNFKDSYRYNIAAFRVARLLDLQNVPMSVERSFKGHDAAFTWWVDDVLMDETGRLKKGAPPNWQSTRTASQIHIMRVFDELIANNDRNQGNILWTTDGTLWLIDHTRAFRLTTSLKNPKRLERIERDLLENMRGLTLEKVQDAIANRNVLSKYEIQSLLARRDAIVKLFDAKIAERGAGKVLYAFD